MLTCSLAAFHVSSSNLLRNFHQFCYPLVVMIAMKNQLILIFALLNSNRSLGSQKHLVAHDQRILIRPPQVDVGKQKGDGQCPVIQIIDILGNQRCGRPAFVIFQSKIHALQQILQADKGIGHKGSGDIFGNKGIIVITCFGNLLAESSHIIGKIQAGAIVCNAGYREFQFQINIIFAPVLPVGQVNCDLVSNSKVSPLWAITS